MVTLAAELLAKYELFELASMRAVLSRRGAHGRPLEEIQSHKLAGPRLRSHSLELSLRYPARDPLSDNLKVVKSDLSFCFVACDRHLSDCPFGDWIDRGRDST